MKNFTIFTRTLLSLIFVLLIVQNSNAALYSINNTITGTQEVPPVVTSGSGTITGTYNDVTNSLSFTVNFGALIGTTTAAHFHGPAAPGVNAGVAIGYAAFPTGVTGGTYSNTYILTAAQETQLLSGLWYSNIHTGFRPGGEIRGQVTPVALSSLDLTAIIEGFYDDVGNVMVRDTVTVNLREGTSPFNLVDSRKAYLSNSGNAIIDFTGASNGVNYYLQIVHRNGLETWSNITTFAANAMTYDFTTAASQAFGNNLKLKGTKYCNFSGDVNGDGTIDGSDGSDVDNGAAGFLSGYVPEDCDGNDFVDGSDGAIVDNNASNFVAVIRP